MKLKNILFALSLTLVAFGLVACGDKDDDAVSGEKENVANDEVTLHLAALESAYGSEVWENIIEDYEALNENVTIDLTIEKNLEEVIRPEMQAGDYPDIFLLATDREEALTETRIKRCDYYTSRQNL